MVEVGEDVREAYRVLEERIKASMAKIKRKIVVLSGKGGVGKSTVAVNLALALAASYGPETVGILDADITGPSIPKMLGVRGMALQSGPPGIFPAFGPMGVKIVSMDFLLPSDETPVIWRGPLKSSAIRQFLGEIVWGKLEYLLTDLPPGTGDEALTVIQSIPKVDGAIIVTIPSEVSELVVKKAVEFARRLNTPILGIVENMAEFRCPKCGAVYQILRSGAGERIAEQMGVRLLGKIPLDPTVSETSDAGKPIVASDPQHPIAKTFMKIAEEIDSLLKASS
ncbi:MAG: ATP-binding protein [Candidatus Hecatellales archaeon]|nr:MAG: ATP-binding protein [Candidatus Hecatellales archaeon]